MCSIIGYKGTYNKELVQDLLYNSRIRGLHAFGYSFIWHGVLTTHKFLDYKEFVISLHNDAPDTFIAHFRYSTSGDYTVRLNNQPLYSRGISMAFNGVIDMGSKQSMEKRFELRLDTENDGELAILRYAESPESFQDLVADKTFSGVFLHENGDIKYYTNGLRPLAMFESIEVSVIASTLDILDRSGMSGIQCNKKELLCL